MNYRGECCGCGIGDCSHLRVTASLRWTGWVPFDKDPTEDVIETRYRNCVVVDTIEVNDDYEAFIFTREPTEAEEAAGYYEEPTNVGLTSWTSGASEYALYTDEYGVGVNWTYGHFTVERTITGRLYGDQESPFWRAIGDTDCIVTEGARDQGNEWPIEGLPSGYGCQPFTSPQYFKVEAHCVTGGETEIESEQTTECCDGDCDGFTTDWSAVDVNGFPTAGNGCPFGVTGFPNPFGKPAPAEGNAKTNISKVAFDAFFSSLAGGTPDSVDVSGGGLVLTVVWSNAGGDTLTRVWTLSDPWTLEEAELEANQLLGRVGLTSGAEYYTCDGGTITVGCEDGESPRLGVTEDPVCVDGVVVQAFTVMTEAELLGADLADGFMAQRTREPHTAGGCGQYIVLTKSGLVVPSGQDACLVTQTWTDDVSAPTDGAPSCSAISAGFTYETPQTPRLSPTGPGSEVWGYVYYDAS